MPAIWATRRDGSTAKVEVGAGQSLMRALKRGGIGEIAALCGGCTSCGTCHVYVAGGWLDRLPPIADDEEIILALSDWRKPNSRLSCQIRVTEELDGLSLTVAPED